MVTFFKQWLQADAQEEEIEPCRVVTFIWDRLVFFMLYYQQMSTEGVISMRGSDG